MQEYLFFPFAAWILISALMVVLCRQPMHAALGFGLSSLGTAALCAMVKAPFLAAAQALVYGGTAGLVSATLFAALAVKGEGDLRRVYGAAALGIAFLVLLARYLLASRVGTESEIELVPVDLGDLLFGEYALALYIVAALLLTASMAVVVLIRDPGYEGDH